MLQVLMKTIPPYNVMKNREDFIFGEEFMYVLSNLFSNQFSMYLYVCCHCVNTYLEINTV